MANGEILQGQQYDRATDTIARFTEQMCDVPTAAEFLDEPRTEVTPNDRGSSKVRQFNLAQLTTYFETFYRSNITTLEGLDIPDVLLGLTVVWESTKGDGDYSSNATGFSTGETANLSLNENGNSQASAVVIPDLIPVIKTYPRRAPGVDYFFYLAGNVSQADVITRLSAITGQTVHPWPVFKAEPLEFTLRGRHISVSARVDIQQTENVSPSNLTYTKSSGKGTSEEVGSSVRTKSFSPTIHGQINLGGSTSQITGTADSSVGWNAGTNWPALSAHATKSAIAQGSVTPNIVYATSPASVPTTNLYVHRINPGSPFFGFTPFHCEVIDMSIFA